MTTTSRHKKVILLLLGITGVLWILGILELLGIYNLFYLLVRFFGQVVVFGTMALCPLIGGFLGIRIIRSGGAFIWDRLLLGINILFIIGFILVPGRMLFINKGPDILQNPSTFQTSDESVRAFGQAFTISSEGDRTLQISYSFLYYNNLIEPSVLPENPSVVRLKEMVNGQTHTITFLDDQASRFSSSRELWNQRYAASCPDCKEEVETITIEDARDLVMFANATREIMVFAHGPGFVVLDLQKPTDTVRKLLGTLVISRLSSKISEQKTFSAAFQTGAFTPSTERLVNKVAFKLSYPNSFFVRARKEAFQHDRDILSVTNGVVYGATPFESGKEVSEIIRIGLQDKDDQGKILHTFLILDKTGSKLASASSQDVWNILKQCPTCTAVKNTLTLPDARDVLAFANEKEKWIIFQHDPGFVVAHFQQPSEDAEKVLQSLVITTTKLPSPIVKPSPPMVGVITFAHTTFPVLPLGFTAAGYYFVAFQDQRRTGPSWIEVDWFRLHAVVNGKDSIIDSADFKEDQPVCGGLYEFKNFGETEESVPYEIDKVTGYAVIRPSERPDRIYHWWTCHGTSRFLIPPDAERVWAEAKVRVHGPVAVQLGIDAFRSPTSRSVPGVDEFNHKEAGTSDWFFDNTADWQIITVN
ncbi:MAG: DUF308 domain-containing protein [bacterium]|nr:DUF308 domain-containing protein [bacterium]